MYKRYWSLEVDGAELPIVFVSRREAIQYADEHLAKPYVLIRHDQFKGETRQPNGVR